MLVAADGSDVVYRRARLEEMVYKVRGQMQYLNKVGVFTVDCGEEEMVKPSDLSIVPDSLGIPRWWRGASWPWKGTGTGRGGRVQASMYVSSMMEE